MGKRTLIWSKSSLNDLISALLKPIIMDDWVVAKTGKGKGTALIYPQ